MPKLLWEPMSNDKGPLVKIALVDDYDEIRELVTFMLESHLNAQVTAFPTGNSAIQAFRLKFDYDIVISDMNMPDGGGADLYLYLRNVGNEVPFIFLTTEIPQKHPQLKNTILKAYGHITKPFTDSDLVKVIKDSLNLGTQTPTYVPVHINLLRKITQVNAPLFVKINDNKFIKVTNEGSVFSEADYVKYEQKGLTHLHTESTFIDRLLKEFRKESLSEDAFNNNTLAEAAEKVSINVDLMRSAAEKMGWTKDIVDLASDNLKRGLALAKMHQELQSVFFQFLRIERLGFADHCSLLVLLTTGIAKGLNLGSPKVIRQLTFASLFHDATLTDSQYNEKQKLVKFIERKENLHLKDVKDVMIHSAKAADLVRNWDFSPPGAEDIIFSHHESPAGTGFPVGKKAIEIEEIPALFIIAEDLVDFFLEGDGSPDLKAYLESRKTKYNKEPFQKIYESVRQKIEGWNISRKQA
jgi:CheY-like chemotaxis protein